MEYGNYGFGIAVYLIGIMIAVSGISLGLGYAVNNKKFKDFGKEELYQSIMNGALVGIMFLAVAPGGMVDSLVNSVAGGNMTMLCPSSISGNIAICLTYNYLIGNGYEIAGHYHASILSTATGILIGLYSLNAALGVIAAIKINLAIVTLSFGSIVTPVMSEIEYIIKMVSAADISAITQGAIVLFISASAMSIIFPTGIILRAFYPTRKLGGFLMALGAGLYVVYPLTYVMNAYISASYQANIDLGNLTSVANEANGVETNVINGSAYSSSNSIMPKLQSYMFSGVNALYQSVTGVLNTLMYWIGYLIVYSFILPAFSLVTTGIAIREFASALGSEARLGKFDLM